jgi:uncharacterized delta-60 repeat protein
MFATLWRSRTPPSARPRRVRPTVQALEDRTLLSAGDLDPTFGDGGKVITSLTAVNPERFNSVAIQADGKIVAAGVSVSRDGGEDFAVARYLPTGAPDPGFGGGTGHPGVVLTDRGAADEATAVLIQPDQKILVAGVAGLNDPFPTATLVRYLPDGSRDQTFGDHGVALGEFALRGDLPVRIALQPDGKILLAFSANTGSNSNDVALTRYTAAGAPDASFGSNPRGTVLVDFGATDSPQGVAVQPDGKIVVAANTQAAGSLHVQVALARLDPSGNPDPHFGSGGKVLAADTHGDLIDSLVLQPDGKIVVGGYEGAFGAAFVVDRFNADGTADGGFGAGGRAAGEFGPGLDVGAALALQPDGKILQAGYSEGPTADGHLNVALLRYNADGSLDGTFGAGGKALADLTPSNDLGRAVAVQADGGIVVAGEVQSPNDFAVMRFEGRDSLTLGPGTADASVILLDGMRVSAKALAGGPPGGRLQRLTLRNVSGEAIRGPLWLVLDHLPRGVRLRHRAGVTRNHGTPGSPYVAVPLPGGVLNPGQQVRLVLTFTNPQRRKVRFTPLLLEGAGVL